MEKQCVVKLRCDLRTIFLRLPIGCTYRDVILEAAPLLLLNSAVVLLSTSSGPCSSSECFGGTEPLSVGPGMTLELFVALKTSMGLRPTFRPLIPMIAKSSLEERTAALPEHLREYLKTFQPTAAAQYFTSFPQKMISPRYGFGLSSFSSTKQ